MRLSLKASLGMCCALLATPVFAEIIKARFTQFPDGLQSTQVVRMINQRLNTKLTPADFSMVEKTTLATSNFEMMVQTREKKPIMGTRLRIWKNKQNQIIAAEAHVETSVPVATAKTKPNAMLDEEYLKDGQNLEQQKVLVRKVISQHHDKVIADLIFEDLWKGEDFLRVFTGEGARGVHTVIYSHARGKLVEASYEEHHQADELPPVQAMGYKIYEQNWFDSTQSMEPEVLELKHLNSKVVSESDDPYAALTTVPFISAKYSDELGSTEEGRKLGHWNYNYIQGLGVEAEKKIVPIDNGFDGPQGLLLDGRYIAINVHPAALGVKTFAAIPWRFSSEVQPEMINFFGQAALKFRTAFNARSYTSADQMLDAPVRDPKHDLATYIEEGTDQIQVYWAVTEMMDRLQELGFTDPEISTRKFQAYLYNPDPFYRNNAFYVKDTINFTTYSPDNSNYARDNTVIWHEMGHGIIDRLLGEITLVKGEGFHEGLADFIAELVIQATSFQREFPGRTGQRIYNVSAFNFANESHDDGEAFGGFMKDVLDAAIAKWGKQGFLKLADLTLEAMRFTRGHPALDEQEWVEKLLFADSRSNLIRSAGEFAPLIKASLMSRNFSWDGKNLAHMQIVVNDKVLQRGDLGSRNRPIVRPRNVESRFAMKVRLNDGDSFKFTYPLTIRIKPVNGERGPIDWMDEELGPKTVTLKNATEEATVEFIATGKCDILNQGDSCSEGLMVEVFEGNAKKPRARQRLYLQLGGMLNIFQL